MLNGLKSEFCKTLAASLVAAFVVLGASQRALAQQPPTEGTQVGPGETFRQDQKTIEKKNMSVQLGEKYYRKDHSVGTGFALYLGIDSGYIVSQSSAPDLVSDKKGYLLAGKLISSLYPEHWVFDLGLGWFYSSLKGTEKYLDPKTQKRDSFDSDVSIITYAATVEASVRLRLFDQLHFGPVVQGFFGSDVSFLSESRPESFTAFAGGQLFYGIPDKTGDLRFGITYLLSLNAPEAKIHQILGGIQLGLPLVRPDEVYKEKSFNKVTKKTEVREVPKTNVKIVTKDVVKFVVDRNLLPFRANRALLSPEMQRFLMDLALTLKTVDDTWEEITIEGHSTKEPASNEENLLRLSGARAAAVKNALVTNGIPPQKAKSRGFGTQRLYMMASPQSPANERIELSFAGVTNAGRLNEALSLLQKKRLKPETCNDEGCK